MKRVIFEYIPAYLLLTILGFIVLHAPITVYVSAHWPEIGLYVKAWKELLMTLAGLLIVADYMTSGRWRAAVRDKIVWAVAAFVGLHFALLLVTNASVQTVMAGYMIDLRYIVYFGLIYLYLKRYPSYCSSFLRIGLLGAVIVSAFALLQLVLPHDFLKYIGYGPDTIEPYMTVDKNPDYIRYSSTLRGPNPLGAYAIMVITGLIAYVISLKRRDISKGQIWLLSILGFGGLVSLWVSYSRAALIGAAIAVVILIAMMLRRKLTRRVLISGVIALAVILGTLYGVRDTSFVQNVILHNNPTTGAAIDSNQGHIDSLQEGIERTLHEPIGAGIGSTGSASFFGDDPVVIENQFLFIAHEAGWLGLGVFLTLIIIVMRQLWQRRDDWRASAAFASGIGLLVVGLFLPVWVDDTVSIVWWGIVAVILSEERVRHARTSNKKAKRAA